MDKRIVTGIVAHVDAGKTTLSEALLFQTGSTRKLGRVDHGDAFLDTNAIERARGITIYTEPASVRVNDLELTLLDTPGHVDFSAEMERTLRVLDYAILVVSGTDGVQGHTLTLWRLLARYEVPTFIFVNKMDAPGADKSAVMDQLVSLCSDACFDCSSLDFSGAHAEQLAMQSESAMEEYLEHDALRIETVQGLIASRCAFPCFFGSALKMQGIDEFLNAIETLVLSPKYPDDFGARVYKVSHDAQGNRLSWLKITGGQLKAKMMVRHHDCGDEEKIDQVRVYSGAKFSVVDALDAGQVCAVSGLAQSFPGEGFGFEHDALALHSQPVLMYTLIPGDCDPHQCLQALRELDDEDPLLHVVWDEHEIRLQLMGQVQLEIIEQILRERYGLDVSFGPGSIVYKETVTAPVEGVGHFEPLRHYAEAHIAIEPLPQGLGIECASALNEDELDRNWQRLILSHCVEREHRGVLTGGALTDVKLTLVAARAHLKHTEGGDFRQATYRAIEQGLMQARERGLCQLLEPWYQFRIEVPQEAIGRVMSDVQRMSGTFESPVVRGEYAVLEGAAPASEMCDYAMDIHVFTHGLGTIAVSFDGYRPCHNAQEVMEQSHYDPEGDVEYTPDSVFCAHGAGYPVKWYKVPEFMHLPYATRVM